MLLPLSDSVWSIFFRGMAFGFLAGLVLIVLFLWGGGKYGVLAASRPIGFVYFLAGVEVGIAVIGIVVFAGLHALRIQRQHIMDRMKNGGAS